MSRTGSKWWVSTEQWRKACKPSDTLLTVVVVDPCVRFVLPLILATGISPNGVTLARLGVAGAGVGTFAAGHLTTGALLFVLWYVLDCIDGKVARLTETCSKFGDWLDRMTDRLGIGAMVWGLALHALWSGELVEGVLLFTLVAVWFLRTMNGDRLGWLMVELTPPTRVAGSMGNARLDDVRRFSRWAEGRRLTPWIVHDVEWLSLALVAGPLLDAVGLCCAIAMTGMILQTVLRTSVFWWRRRNAEPRSAHLSLHSISNGSATA